MTKSQAPDPGSIDMRAALASLPPITPAQNAILARMAEEQRADVEAAIAASSKAKRAAHVP